MENTSSFLFDNVDEKYFLAVKGKAVGPLTAQEVYERVERAEVGLLHYCWCEGWSDWKRLCDEREFAVLIPQKPSVNSIRAISDKLAAKKAAAATVSEDVKNCYLYYNSSQYGPFSKNELLHVLKTNRLGRNAYLWMPGWSNWKRLAEIPEYANYLPALEEKTRGSEPSVRLWRKGEKTKSRKIKRRVSEDPTLGASLGTKAGIDASERRRAPRRPLVARLFLHNDQDVIIAVCRDISVGGMQVLTDRVPGEVGSTVKLNVSPGDPAKVKSFVAEGEIVRILEDGRGFSFRFKRMTDEARRALEKYIKE